MTGSPVPTTIVSASRSGLPDGSRDMLVEKSLLMECGFDELNGIDWQKGCYLGQELTARTRYRGLVKKRLLPVAVEGRSAAARHADAARRQGGRRSAFGRRWARDSVLTP